MTERILPHAQISRSPLQLQELVPIYLHAKRYPVSGQQPSTLHPKAQVFATFTLLSDTQCQMEVRGKIEFDDSFRPFEIEAAIVGHFTFEPLGDLTGHEEEVGDYFQQLTMPIMFPFLREAISDLCTRLRLPPILLPLLSTTLSQATSSGEVKPQRGQRKRSTPSSQPETESKNTKK